MVQKHENGMNDSPAKKIGYRVLRSTVVLAENSKAIDEIRDRKLLAVVGKVHRINFDFEQLTDRDLEVLYAYFDDEFMGIVKEEFTFRPYRGSIRDNGARLGVCCLCGKGDSKDEGDNADHLRYEFLLTNISGGKNVWCGSTCIINYGLRVQGAETGEEAKKILEKTLREHKHQWEIDVWQAENGDHERIPDQYQEFRRVPHQLQTYGGLQRYFGELQLAGFDMDAISIAANGKLARDFRTATRFYQRKGFLSESKTTTWSKAKALLSQIQEATSLLESGRDIPNSDERIDHFLKIGAKRAKVARQIDIYVPKVVSIK